MAPHGFFWSRPTITLAVHSASSAMISGVDIFPLPPRTTIHSSEFAGGLTGSGPRSAWMNGSASSGGMLSNAGATESAGSFPPIRHFRASKGIDRQGRGRYDSEA